MPWGFTLSLLHMNISGVNIQGNPLLSVSGNGGTYISQANSNGQSQPYPVFRALGHNPYPQPLNTHAIERCIEAQPRIRRKLDEARGCSGSIYGIENVAQVATDIVAVVEESPPSAFSNSLVCLAMNAHAVAYIALISCLYGFDENGRRRITKASVRKLRRFLSGLHELLVDEAPKRGILFRMKKVFTKGRRNAQVLRMQDELLDILRDIEKNENADILTSLTLALDCPYQ